MDDFTWTLTDKQRAVVVATEALARCQRRRRWRRKHPTIDFVPAAAHVVAALGVAGYIQTPPVPDTGAEP